MHEKQLGWFSGQKVKKLIYGCPSAKTRKNIKNDHNLNKRHNQAQLKGWYYKIKILMDRK